MSFGAEPMSGKRISTGQIEAGEIPNGPFGQESRETMGSRLRAFGAGLFRSAEKLLEKFQSRPRRRLRVSETVSLGEKRQLLLVEFGDRQLLIGAAGNFLATLGELPSSAEVKGNATPDHE